MTSSLRPLPVVLLAASLGGFPSFAHAELEAWENPRNVVQVGYARGSVLRNRSPLLTTVTPNAGTAVLGVPERFDSPGAGVEVQDIDVLAVSYRRRFGEHWSVELDAGVPPIVDGTGFGTFAVPTRAGAIQPTDLGDPALQPLGSARQWAPVVLLQYHLRPGWCRQFCPWVGAGFSYMWFTEERLSPAFAARVDATYGEPLALAAGKPGPTTAHARVQDTVAPVVAAGITYALTQRVGLAASLGFSPVRTDAELSLLAADGSELGRTRAKVAVDGLVSALLLSYGWGD